MYYLTDHDIQTYYTGGICVVDDKPFLIKNVAGPNPSGKGLAVMGILIEGEHSKQGRCRIEKTHVIVDAESLQIFHPPVGLYNLYVPFKKSQFPLMFSFFKKNEKQYKRNIHAYIVTLKSFSTSRYPIALEDCITIYSLFNPLYFTYKQCVKFISEKKTNSLAFSRHFGVIKSSQYKELLIYYHNIPIGYILNKYIYKPEIFSEWTYLIPQLRNLKVPI